VNEVSSSMEHSMSSLNSYNFEIWQTWHSGNSSITVVLVAARKWSISSKQLWQWLVYINACIHSLINLLFVLVSHKPIIQYINKDTINIITLRWSSCVSVGVLHSLRTMQKFQAKILLLLPAVATVALGGHPQKNQGDRKQHRSLHLRF
jgi:hypothetical protein